MIIYVGANKTCHIMIIHFAQKYLGSAWSLCMHSYNFELCHMAAQTSHLYGFTEVIKFIVCIKNYFVKTKNCLYADYS